MKLRWLLIALALGVLFGTWLGRPPDVPERRGKGRGE
jgi:hypothetical protein